MENWLQNLALVFCWLVGCFPAVSPLQKSVNFLFKWRSIAACYSLLLITITVVDSCIIVHLLPTIGPLLENGAFALVILACGFTSRALVLLFRVLAIFSCKQEIRLVQDLKALQDFCLDNGGCKSLQTDRRWKVVILATLIVLILKVYRNFEFAISQLTGTGSPDPLTMMNSTAGAMSPYAPLWIWSLTNATLVQNAAMTLIVFLSVTIAQSHLAYMKLLEEWSSGNNSTAEATGGDITKKEMIQTELMQRFFDLKRSFKVFTNVVGLYAFAILIWDGANIVYNVYFVFWPKLNQVSQLSLSYSIVSPLIVMYCGNNIQNQVNEWRDRFDEIQTRMTLCDWKNAGLLPLVMSVRQWNWKLSSAGIVTIDNGAIPAFITALTTFLIFIVQLEISEPTSA